MRRHILSSRCGGPRSWSSATAVPFALCFHPHSLGEPTLFGGSVHYEILLLGLLRRRCNLRSGLSCRMDQVRMAQSPYARDPKRWDTKPRRSRHFMIRVVAGYLLFFSFTLLSFF